VRQLKERGLIATPAYVVIPPDKLVEKDAAITKIKNLGADAVLILRMTDKTTIQQTSIAAPGTADRSRLSGYYAYAFDAPIRDASDTAFLETNLFDVRTEQRIWTARSVTKVDVIDQKALSDFIKIMIDRLALDGMIP
jgi:hypothetical protein